MTFKTKLPISYFYIRSYRELFHHRVEYSLYQEYFRKKSFNLPKKSDVIDDFPKLPIWYLDIPSYREIRNLLSLNFPPALRIEYRFVHLSGEHFRRRNPLTRFHLGKRVRSRQSYSISLQFPESSCRLNSREPRRCVPRSTESISSGGGGKCAPQSRAYPTITGDEGGETMRRCRGAAL